MKSNSYHSEASRQRQPDNTLNNSNQQTTVRPPGGPEEAQPPPVASSPGWHKAQIEYLSKETLASLETQCIAAMPAPASQDNTLREKMLEATLPQTPIPEQQELSAATPSARELSSQPTLLLDTLQPSLLMTRKKTLFALLLLSIVIFHALASGATQFLGPHGWAYTLGSSTSSTNADLLNTLNHRLQKTPTAGTATKTPVTPQQYVNLIIQNMTLDQKLGQMMLIQFLGPDYSFDLHTMISKYNVGAVLIFASNGNIVDKTQLKQLIQQMQNNSKLLPLAVSIDQEGGYVNRLEKLDGPRPAAAAIGETRDPAKAKAAGLQDAQDLQSYGINVNLAPVVDVDTTDASEIHNDLRAYGRDAATVTSMASAYLQGLQQSGKVIGTLKHFPGLGSVVVDPHKGIAHLARSRAELEKIDWAPYRALIQQGNVHAVMVTHEIVDAVDSTKPASLSPAVIQGILRNDLGFQGVVMTDSLTMTGVTSAYTPGQAAALSIEAGADLLMGASTPGELAMMIDGIKQAMNAGTITQQRIDDAVRHILLMKYAMGLLSIPRA
ncbi:MAG: hypothetical protein IMW89_16220 [Ktedonobacteraceae bacterium]|nr:hypothetical protein [Ktedonobacteraceae bacterium]